MISRFVPSCRSFLFSNSHHLLIQCKLEPVTGIPPSTQKITLYQGNIEIGPIDDDARLLGSYPVENFMRLQVTDTNPHRIKNQFTDTSLVEKFELTEEEYAKRTDTVRAFKENNKLGRFSAEAAEQRAAFASENEKAASKIKVGDRCEVQMGDEAVKRRGCVRFIGETQFQPGLWVGIQYDEPMGKNDGSVQGERYFTCPPKYGGFVRPIHVTVGDFPEEDLFDSDDDLEEM
ncbi:hypothetical protein EC973_001048 [Apophysomyces ossiformis]|uniref:CAP-Gly domain-containing protein n=1 Tax=Apophysomyces ossiformis TaxID=679940 RepID=A0A8H7ESU8_9FUNG|nr:hypothetical protein EC973_001048 [Apophysomyces ossiformis]